MAFCWRTDDGLTLNSGLVALRFFRGAGPVLLRKSIFCNLSRGGLDPLPPPPPPSGYDHASQEIFKSCRNVSWFELVLNRVRVLYKESIWCLQRDSIQRPLYLKSSTLSLVDYTGIIQLFDHCIATWYAMSWYFF